MSLSLTVGVGECAVSGKAGEVLKTYALGSCVALAVYDRVQRIAAMIHVAYPESESNPKKAEQQPCYYADSGVPRFMRKLESMGVSRRTASLKLIGGASIMDEYERFNIGKRNVLAVKKILWRDGYGVLSEDIGGTISRTVSLSVDSGAVVISSGNRSWEL